MNDDPLQALLWCCDTILRMRRIKHPRLYTFYGINQTCINSGTIVAELNAAVEIGFILEEYERR